MLSISPISPIQASNAAPGIMSKLQAYNLLKAGNSISVRSLPAGDREILLAKLALDAGHTNEAVRILTGKSVEKNSLAALIKAEAYRRQSLAAARRAGHYAHAVTGDIGKLQKARLNGALDLAEARLQAFMAGHAASQPTRTKPISVATSVHTTHADLPDSVRQAIHNWRKDWESRDADLYLSHYHPDFRTRKYDFTSWSTYKRRVNSRKKYIKITLSGLKMLRGPEQIAEGEAVLVTFNQRYQSSNYAANSRKQLYLVRRHNTDKWLILFEGDANHRYHRATTRAASQVSQNKHHILATAQPGTWAINLGSFGSAANAEQMVSHIQLSGRQQPFVSSPSVNGKVVHRVSIGFYANRSTAVEMMVKICPKLGLTDCWLEQAKR